ncbi:MAG UNVERIFIED_CONTAM: GlsB/YeaQ/YmgE family stress response membrane protein [Microcystis novacekii LVE1205-3]|jgi:uncharacterized membrane protein YeaQ/YmgE (transglycosylase-associated protein family)
MFNLIAWVILGLLAGAIAKMIYPGTQGGGFIATMFLGIIGAFMGEVCSLSSKTGSLQLAECLFEYSGGSDGGIGGDYCDRCLEISLIGG